MDTPDDVSASRYEEHSINALITGTTQLQNAIVALTESVGLLLRRDRVTRRLAVVAVAAVVSVLAVVGITAKVWTTTYVTQKEQTQTRTRVLCPLYTLMVSSVDPAKKAALTPAQVRALQVIQDGYDALECKSLTPTPPPH